MWKEKTYMEVSDRFYVGRTSKVGQTSITNMLAPRCSRPNVSIGEVIDAKNRNSDVRVIAFIRNPLDRLQSAFSYFSGNGQWTVDRLHVNTWESFIDNCALVGQDHHWAPQHLLHEHQGNLVPTEWYHFDDFEEVSRSILGVEPQHRNPSKRRICVDTTYREEELRDFFSVDWDIYENLAI